MAVNKVEINGEVKLDLTQDTVTADTLLKGSSAHDAAGNPVEGKVITIPIPVTEDVLKGDGRGGIDTIQTSPVESIDIPVGIFKGTASGNIETAIPGMDYLAEAPVTSVNGKTGDVTVSEIPSVTASDNGKFLRVVSGAWAAVSISDAHGGSF